MVHCSNHMQKKKKKRKGKEWNGILVITVMIRQARDLPKMCLHCISPKKSILKIPG